MYVQRGSCDQGVSRPTSEMSAVTPSAIHTSVQSSGCGGIAAVSGARSPTTTKGMNRRWIFRSSGLSVVTRAYIG